MTMLKAKNILKIYNEMGAEIAFGLQTILGFIGI